MNHPAAALAAVIFDLDGTLVDTADDFVPAVVQLQSEYGQAPIEPSRIRSSVSNGSRSLVKLALGLEESNPEFDTARQRLLDLYAQLLGEFAQPYPGIRLLIERLESRGIAWGIATNKPKAYTLPLLESLSLRAQSVICPDDVAEAKPHPESLHKACRDIGCATHEAIYIGDHARDIEAGQRAGLYTIAAAYGYIEPGDSAEAWGADDIAHSSHDLDSLLFPAG